jgi:hypothetical protein
MKKIIFMLLAGSVCLMLLSCGGGKGPADVLNKIQKAQLSGDPAEAKKFYTEGTIKLMEEMKKIVPSAKGDTKFVSGAAWKVVDEKINGDFAELRVKYVEHPVENMKGLEIPFRLKKESGEWKIDMENELKQAIMMINSMKEMPGIPSKAKK